MCLAASVSLRLQYVRCLAVRMCTPARSCAELVSADLLSRTSVVPVLVVKLLDKLGLLGCSYACV